MIVKTYQLKLTGMALACCYSGCVPSELRPLAAELGISLVEVDGAPKFREEDLLRMRQTMLQRHPERFTTFEQQCRELEAEVRRVGQGSETEIL
jgi:hypothetical protein